MKKYLDDKDLEKVSGGDRGDHELEFADTPDGVRYLYEVGEQVEVYNTEFHSTTKTGVIVSRYPVIYRSGCDSHYGAKYEIRILQTGAITYTTAKGIVLPLLLLPEFVTLLVFVIFFDLRF